MTPSGKLTTLHSFTGADGKYPVAALIHASNGNLYGTAYEGGNVSASWCKFGCGTIFEITTSGAFTALYAFCPTPGSTPCADGTGPDAGLVQTTDGNFYGTTAEGGSANSGVIFKLTSAGALTPFYSFCTEAGCPDGSAPVNAMVQSTDGNLYGTAGGGGSSSNPGTIFTVSIGLNPFVRTLQSFGKVGSSVIILGSDLSGATGVNFNGTAALFTVVSATEITTTVPTGATSGEIRVVTPGGTLSSNVTFHVIP